MVYENTQGAYDIFDRFLRKYKLVSLFWLFIVTWIPGCLMKSKHVRCEIFFFIMCLLLKSTIFERMPEFLITRDLYEILQT